MRLLSCSHLRNRLDFGKLERNCGRGFGRGWLKRSFGFAAIARVVNRMDCHRRLAARLARALVSSPLLRKCAARSSLAKNAARFLRIASRVIHSVISDRVEAV